NHPTMVPPPGILALTRWQRFGLILALWTVLGLIDAGQFYVHVNYFRSRTMYWEEALASGLADWYVWALLAPFIFRLGRRFPLDAAHWPVRLPLHLATAAGFILLKVALDLPLAWAIHGRDPLLGASFRTSDPQSLRQFVIDSYKLYVLA